MKRSAVIKKDFAFVLAAIAVLAVLTVVLTLRGQSGKNAAGDTELTAEQDKNEKKEVVSKSGLKYVDLKVGTGAKAEVGSTVTVHCTGWLKDGTKFYSTLDGKEPLEVTIGAGRVIKGWEEGLQGMKEGGKRKLIIPYQLAYGEEGREPSIPPKADLTFDIEMLKVKNK